MTKEEKHAYDQIYYVRYKQRRYELNRIWREANPELVAIYHHNWPARNPEWRDQTAGRVMKRYAAKKRAIPKWSDLTKIKAIYEEATKTGMHVDHIVPLQSKFVCGLHVPANLQLLPPTENFRKGNRNWPGMPGQLLQKG